MGGTQSSAFDRISTQGQAFYPYTGTALCWALGTSGEVTVVAETENVGDANECSMRRDIAEITTVKKKLAKEAP